MEITELISTLGNRLGITLEPNKDGIYAFEADDLMITVFPLPELDTTALNGDLGTPPPERLDALYKTLLEANHLFIETHGATISLNPENGHFEICKALQHNLLDADTFFSEVERFVNVAEFWSKIIKNYRGPSEKDDTAVPAFEQNGFLQV